MFERQSKRLCGFLRALPFVAIVLPWIPAQAATPPDAQAIRYLAERKLWLIQTKRTSYLMGVNEQNALQHLYWGGRILRDQDFPAAHTARRHAFESTQDMTTEEYPAWGGIRYQEPCLKVTFADGVRDLVLKYVSHEMKGNTLKILTKDTNRDVAVELSYRVFPDHDIICKSSTIRNQTSQSLVVESAQSGVWHVPPGEGYRLTYLPGRYVAENQVTRETIHQGIKVLESRRGVTSHQMNPWFAIDHGGEAGEERGRVWFGALGWSGSWKLAVEQTPYRQVRVTGGFNDFDFGYQLKPGETLKTPAYYGGYTEDGFGGSSRLMHDFERDNLLPPHPPPNLRPVIFMSYYATKANINETNQRQYAEQAAQLGAEVLLIHDGWFANRKTSFNSGLGDWSVDPEKFPNGLKPVVDHARGLGIDVGLWVEPEGVSPDSRLYREHPDWVIAFPDRPQTMEMRNQYILNLARKEVAEHVFEVFDRLVTQNDIRFLMWDMNNHFSQPGWPQVPVDEQKQIWVKYVTNLYDVMDRLRARHPHLQIESSQGGGGRVDLGFLQRVDQINNSDNCDTVDKLRIWEGYSLAYAPRLFRGAILDDPGYFNHRRVPLDFRLMQNVSLGGALRISLDTRKWPAADLAKVKQAVDYYKSVRATMQDGDLYRLFSPSEGDLAAMEYVAKDRRQAVLFAFRHSQIQLRPVPTIHLKGLDEQAVYRVKPYNDKLLEKQQTLSGAYLMHRGLNFNLVGEFDSTSVLLEKIE